MQRFNRHFRGFLSLLDAKVGGLTPTNYEDAVRVTVDAAEFIFANTREVTAGNTGGLGTAAEGFAGDVAGTLTVPADEMWLVDNYTTRATAILGAAEELVAVPAMSSRLTITGNLGFQVFANVLYPGTANFASSPSFHADRPFIALPGDVLGAWVSRIVTAATIDITLTASFSRLKV